MYKAVLQDSRASLVYGFDDVTESLYRRSGNFRVIKFLCFKFSRKNIFVVQDTHENFLMVLHSQV